MSFSNLAETDLVKFRNVAKKLPVQLRDFFLANNRNNFKGLTNAVAPTLFFEFVGTRNHVDEQIETVKWCTDEYNGIPF